MQSFGYYEQALPGEIFLQISEVGVTLTAGLFVGEMQVYGKNFLRY
jgi:hypothetical protein